MEIIVLKATYEPDGAILFDLDIEGEFSYFAYRANDPYSGVIGLFLTAWILEHENEILPWIEPEPQPYLFRVIALWERLTDDEAEAFDEIASTKGPLRIRKQFALATSMQSDSELFLWVEEILVGLFGETRTAELLSRTLGEGAASKDATG